MQRVDISSYFYNLFILILIYQLARYIVILMILHPFHSVKHLYIYAVRDPSYLELGCRLVETW